MGDGTYVLGSMEVSVKNGVARLVEGGSIAGRHAHQDVAFRRAVQKVGLSAGGRVEVSSLTPARVLGLDDTIGSIAWARRARPGRHERLSRGRRRHAARRSWITEP
ncbi:hypothetical protein [Nonomuraea dietziae]|uniref:hypothetical protein n=1 Tax=Nonomuraea dietziae TaxID=65515 RepID=UPI0031DF53D4